MSNLFGTSLPHSFIWSLTNCGLVIYSLLISIIIFYLLPNIRSFSNVNFTAKRKNFFWLSGTSLIPLFATPLLVITLIVLAWSGPSVVVWYSHLIYHNWHYRISYLVIMMFSLALITFLTTFVFTNNQTYDFIIVIYNFFFWVLTLFTSNNFFTLIFFIEILSSMILLLLLTSTFSTTYFYNTQNLSKHTFVENSTPLIFFRAVLFFFWLSLIASLALFFFLTLYYMKLLTFEWYLTESIFLFFTSTSNFKSVYSLLLVWALIIFCIFLKCGLVPFFFWKPVFFKGLTSHVLFFYLTFYYFFLLLFFIIFFLSHVNELFFFYSSVFLFFSIAGLLMIFFIFFESYYLKAFLAISSILNTLFIFFAMTNTQSLITLL